MILGHVFPFDSVREFYEMNDKENAHAAMADVSKFLEEAAIRLAAAGMECAQPENRKVFFDAQLACVACERKVRKLIHKV